MKKFNRKGIIWYRLVLVIVVAALAVFGIARGIQTLIFRQESAHIQSDVNAYSYQKKKFKNKNGFKIYTGSDYTYYNGIDVSSHQGDIDWDQVKDSGVDFVMIRCGFSSLDTGKVHTDENFKKNIKAAKKAGLRVGVYYFSSAKTKKEVTKEANYVLNLIKDYDLEFPVAYDMEYYNGASRADSLSKNKKTQLALTFCEKIEDAGYTPLIYGNDTWFTDHVKLSKVKKYALWYASYSQKPNMTHYFAMWQYSNTGSLPGIDGDVDMNIYLEPKES
ncbi:glycoside hydrolase family 25 protein [Catenisphaera adipataccumulans]|uniref:GH25 family lysozyme M1 (1,4-beta-N-acetylmuramidase) n=1 Tax=Catenisphaera adipataccumulans TaxID=700500 RepID=A0A7W8CXI3_9FIRM|nr:glycoside hydrolase family 25 protein [Catenisphaera adipataccumulans]MBB5183166.1 GH25 family lysozyme M1 (1,4-beta-N-acetylmuramidase) [Catenisphaera adipataccumulans]